MIHSHLKLKLLNFLEIFSKHEFTLSRSGDSMRLPFLVSPVITGVILLVLLEIELVGELGVEQGVLILSLISGSRSSVDLSDEKDRDAS